MTNDRIRDQLRRNAVALISLVVAITSLGYNTWRNEASEGNRNQRLIAIEVLRNLGELQEVILYRHWEKDAGDLGNEKTGWALVLTIKDLAQVLEDPLPQRATEFSQTWTDRFAGLGSDRESFDATMKAIEGLRADVHALLRSLD